MKDCLKTARKKSSFILYSLFLAIQRSEIGKRALFLFSKGVKLKERGGGALRGRIARS